MAAEKQHFDDDQPTDEESAELEGWHPIMLEAIEKLQRLSDEIIRRRGGKLFGDSAEEVRQMREERDQYLEHRS